jgi:hypothetical protein
LQRLSVVNVRDQKQALLRLATLTEQATVHPSVRAAAHRIIADCASRDDSCELEAIYEAVKNGTPLVKGLERGVRYVSDPQWADFFTAPNRLLSECAKGACGGDCDDAASLVAALAGSVGFRVGLRVWGQSPGVYSHVYAVAGLPKHNPAEVVGLDTTVPEAYVGWEPPKGHVLTAWLSEEGDD